MVGSKRKLFRYSVDLFIEVLGQVTNRKFSYKCNDKDVLSFDYFYDYFSNNGKNYIGEEFVRKFLLYGIQSWFNDGTERDYSRSVRFNWIFGKSAIERWKKYDIETNVYITRIGIKKDHKINVIRKHTEIPKIVGTLRQTEEKFKAEFHNTRRGLLWCIANTTLYFHKSSSCATCNYKNECKKLLKQEYPKIYLRRGYGER